MVAEPKKRDRMVRMTISNFRCIGDKPVTVDLDDIVVLVGPNNAGKSSILKAYEVIMSEGTKAGELSLEDFPGGRVNSDRLPEIELETIVSENKPGDEWTKDLGDGYYLVREKWSWTTPGKPSRRGFLFAENRWASETDKEKVPWGAAAVACARRPEPHFVSAFDSPEDQAAQIVKLLTTMLTEKMESIPGSSAGKSAYGELLESIKGFQAKVVNGTQKEVSRVERELTQAIAKVFPNHIVKFDAKVEDGLDKSVSLFKGGPELRIGPSDGYLTSVAMQGSGIRRTLLWTALRLLAETKPAKKAQSSRPHVLLIDEPEICLHPSAIRETCDLLYSLPQNGNWQVMVTTHSPQFIDISRDHTTIVRVERDSSGEISGTTVYRPDRGDLTDDDRERLKLLNLYDPYVGEFFFGGRNVVVEGDTEYSAFRYVIAQERPAYNDVHIIRARGKSSIVSVVKILNQFGSRYSVLHDSDTPTATREGKRIKNSAWSQNEAIAEEVRKSKNSVRLVSSKITFEVAFFDTRISGDKPYHAIGRLKELPDKYADVKQLLQYLLFEVDTPPRGAVEWKDLADLEAFAMVPEESTESAKQGGEAAAAGED
jgi:putative ATP-dependent endonuclease of OLD family